MKALFLTLALTLLFCPLTAKVEHLMPRPQQVTLAQEPTFRLGGGLHLIDSTHTSALTRFLAETGCTVDDTAPQAIIVEQVAALDGAFDHQLALFPDEGYALRVRPDTVTIRATTRLGVIRAAQTLTQMAEGWDDGPQLEALDMTDYPAFKYRGLMHDVGRSFLAFDELRHEIDLLSRFKMSVFHWHLTEKLGFRFESKRYPQLNADENMTRYPGSYYTQDECRELEEYAWERGVTIIPEIDMPGHSDVFTRAMGFSMQTDQGVAALKNILDEVCDAFPRAPYIHIGGDEVRITYPRFLETMADYVRSKGRRVICWNRLVAGAPTPAQCDMTHMWQTSGSAVQGLPNIDSRYFYANHHDVYADLSGIYRSQIYYEQRGTASVAGSMVSIWNDTKLPTESDIVRSNNMYAIILATGERAWTGGGAQYIERGGVGMPLSGPETDEFIDWERRFLFHKAHSLSLEPIPYVQQSDVRWRITEPLPNLGSQTRAMGPELVMNQTETLPASYEIAGRTYRARTARGAGFYLRHIWHPNLPSYFATPANNQTAYAWTYVHSPHAQDCAAQIETYTYSRSGSEKMPPEGKWDRRGSRIWVSGEEIAAPQWQQPDANIPQDDAVRGLTNENFTMRPPTPIHLSEGWNLVFLKLPHVNAGGTARDKWQFTFVLTTTDGRDALPGITYSPTRTLGPEAQALEDQMADIRAFLDQHVGHQPGLYPEALASDLTTLLDSVATAIEGRREPLTADEAAAMASRLASAYALFLSDLEGAERVLPSPDKAYYLSTPLRGDRYLTAQGDGQDILGETTRSDNARWTFALRADSAYNIQCAATGLYLSPAAAFNTALKAVATEPAAGWTLRQADTFSLFAIVSGTTQVNQTNNQNLGFKVYNWGSGENLTDTGCQYRIEEAPEAEPAVIPSDGRMTYVYQLSTPLRDGRILTSHGPDQELTGEAAPSPQAEWKFTLRADGAYDIVALADGTYISPASSFNTALKTVTLRPAAGWTLQKAATEGCYAVTSGSAQLNQTNAGLGYKVYNWGSGSNLTDTGCQYLIELLATADGVEGIQNSKFKIHNYYDLTGRRVATPRRGLYITAGRKVAVK